MTSSVDRCETCTVVRRSHEPNDHVFVEPVMYSNHEVAIDYIRRLQEERPECFGNPAYFPAKLDEEAGEARKEANKRLGFSRHPADPEKEGEELADTVISAYAQAIMAGIDLDAAIQAKHVVLMKRSWKVGNYEF